MDEVAKRVIWASLDEEGVYGMRVFIPSIGGKEYPPEAERLVGSDWCAPYSEAGRAAIFQAWGTSERERAEELERAVVLVRRSFQETKMLCCDAEARGYRRGLAEAEDGRASFASAVEADMAPRVFPLAESVAPPSEVKVP